MADSPWPMFQGGPKHTGRSPYNTSHVDGAERWRVQTGGIVLSSPAIGSNGTIYVGSQDNNLYAIGGSEDGTDGGTDGTEGGETSSEKGFPLIGGLLEG